MLLGMSVSIFAGRYAIRIDTLHGSCRENQEIDRGQRASEILIKEQQRLRLCEFLGQRVAASYLARQGLLILLESKSRNPRQK
jgi:hypothetical protein